MYIFIINVKVKNKDKLLKMKKLLKIFIIYSKISYVLINTALSLIKFENLLYFVSILIHYVIFKNTSKINLI